MVITQDDLQTVVDAGDLTTDVRQKILEAARAREEARGNGVFNLTHVAWLTGMVGATMGALAYLVVLSEDHGHGVALTTSVAMMLVTMLLSAAFRARQLNFLSACAGALTAVYLIASATVIYDWNDGDSLKDAAWSVGPLALLIGVIEVSRAHFASAIVILWTGIVACTLLAIDPNEQQEVLRFALHTGWVTLVISYLLHVWAPKRNYTLWLNKVGAAVLGMGLAIFVVETETGDMVDVRLLGWAIGLLLAAGVLRYPSYLVTGFTALATYLSFLVFKLFGDEPAVMAGLVMVAGMGLVAIGTLMYRVQGRWGHRLDAWTPAWLQRLRPSEPTKPVGDDAIPTPPTVLPGFP